MVCPFGRALHEGDFCLVGPTGCPRRDRPKGDGLLVLLDPCAGLSLPPMGSINNNPCACGLFPS